MTLREYIRSARLASKLTLRELGELLDVTHVQVSEWELGKRPVPRRHISALAVFLLVEQADLRRLWDADADERDAAALAKRGAR